MSQRKSRFVVAFACLLLALAVCSDSNAFGRRRRCHPCPPCPCPPPSCCQYAPVLETFGDELPAVGTLSDCPSGFVFVKCSSTGVWTQCCQTGGATCCPNDSACVGCMK